MKHKKGESIENQSTDHDRHVHRPFLLPSCPEFCTQQKPPARLRATQVWIWQHTPHGFHAVLKVDRFCALAHIEAGYRQTPLSAFR
jgi:hypothetical protein